MWVIFSILAALCWAIVSIVDKYVLTKWVRKPIVPVMILGIIGLLASLFIYLFHGFSPLSYLNIIWAFVAGVLYILSMLFYFKAAKIEEISRIAPLWYLTPVFVLILAAIFLGEVFPLIKYLGIFLLVTGAIIISLKNLEKISIGRAFWFMILASLVLSGEAVITKHLLNFTDFWTVFSYIKIGTIFALIPIFYFSFKDLTSTVKEHGKKVIGVISLAEILNLVGKVFITIAIATGYVTLVNALSSVQPFFVLLFAVILSIFYPSIIKEELNKPIIVQKLVAIILMFIGAILTT